MGVLVWSACLLSRIRWKVVAKQIPSFPLGKSLASAPECGWPASPGVDTTSSTMPSGGSSEGPGVSLWAWSGTLAAHSLAVVPTIGRDSCTGLECPPGLWQCMARTMDLACPRDLECAKGPGVPWHCWFGASLARPRAWSVPVCFFSAWRARHS